MKNPIKTKRAAIVTLAAVATLAAATTAWAVFDESVGAEASGTAGDLVSLQVVSTQTDYEGAQNALWPNHPADVIVTVKNTNEVPVELTSITDVDVVSTGSTAAACGDAIQVNALNVPGWPIVVGAAGSATEQVSFTLTDVITMLDSIPDSCQAGTFKTTMTITGKAA